MVLAPLQPPDNVQWDITTQTNWPPSDPKRPGYALGTATLKQAGAGRVVQITGPIKKKVRFFKIRKSAFCPPVVIELHRRTRLEDPEEMLTQYKE
jgi:hypothetical protein